MYCSTCKFCEALGDENNSGLCRRNSPQTFKYRLSERESPEHGKYTEIFYLKGVWPKVDPEHDWCGDYQATDL
jgi:hypothetical protein